MLLLPLVHSLHVLRSGRLVPGLPQQLLLVPWRPPANHALPRPPTLQVCVLTVSTTRCTVRSSNGELEVKTYMKCTLRYDRRAIRDEVAEQWLAALKASLDNPAAVLR